MDRLRADLKDASIQQYDNADAHSVLIRLRSSARKATMPDRSWPSWCMT